MLLTKIITLKIFFKNIILNSAVFVLIACSTFFESIVTEKLHRDSLQLKSLKDTNITVIKK